MTRRNVAIAVVLLAALLGLALLLHRLQGDHSFTEAERHLGGWTYLAIFLIVFGDALFPVLPSETSLIAASTLAAHDALELGLVILVGTAASISGDSALYWITQRRSQRIRRRVEKARSRATIEAALDVLGRHAPVLLVAGRFVPGVRFVVNASMGFSHYPYRRFLVWSAVGGCLWVAYTCLLAAGVATLLPGFPLASVVATGALTMAVIAAAFVFLRRSRLRLVVSVRRRLHDGASDPSKAALSTSSSEC